MAKAGEYIDWYDHDAVQKLYDSRAEKMVSIFSKISEAREKGDEEALKKHYSALRKHREQNEKYKKLAEETHFYWY